MSLHCSPLTFALVHVFPHPSAHSSFPSSSLYACLILHLYHTPFLQKKSENMDGRKRWFADAYNDKAVFEQIMQGFRPIIPKPTTGESGSAVKGEEKSSTKKRKYVRASKCKKRNKEERDSIFTLQLLPADQLPIGRKDSQTPKEGRSCNEDTLRGGTGMKMNSHINIMNKSFTLLRGPLLLDRTVETWVTVERVTGNCMDGRGLGCTDEEMIMNLERDTCPGFISDGENKVKWVNMAYRRMVWEEEEEERGAATPPPQVVVKLVAMADLAESLGFACRVRVQYYNYYYYDDMANCLEKQCRQIVVPCDVWRMEFGGLAWRMDVQAALSLGR